MKPGYVDRFPLKAEFSTEEEKENYAQIIQAVTRINTIAPKDKSELIRREILVLKERIDEMIYRLYGLDGEEKRNVENLVNHSDSST